MAKPATAKSTHPSNLGTAEDEGGETESSSTVVTLTGSSYYSTSTGSSYDIDKTTTAGITSTTSGESTTDELEAETLKTQTTVTQKTQIQTDIGATVRIDPEIKEEKVLLLVRTAERMDRIFPEWLRVNFSDHGNYIPFDLNQPIKLPVRNNGHLDFHNFHNDSPITAIGKLTAKMLGRAIGIHKLTPVELYVSPALRCIQTAAAMLEAIEDGSKPKINIEPGLFEWRNWYGKLPSFPTDKELSQTEVPFNQSYTPIVPLKNLEDIRMETVEALYNRLGRTVEKIVERSPTKGIVLIVGHGVTVDACARKLLRKKWNDHGAELESLGVHYPYCTVVPLRNRQEKRWQLASYLIPQITYSCFNNTADLRILKQ